MDTQLPKLPVLSYSALNAYQVCPRRFHHMYVLKDLHAEEKSKEQLEGTAVHEALKRRVRLDEPLPEAYAHYEHLAAEIFNAPHVKYTELKLGMDADGRPCDFFDKKVWLRGALDLVLSEPGSSVSTRAALLLDWKAGKVREDPFELEIQALLLKAKWPELERITGHFVWLREGRLGARHDCSDTVKTFGVVLRTEQQMRRRLAANDWPPDEGPLCGYCPVTKGMCEFKRERK